jgi:hypothetical protein
MADEPKRYAPFSQVGKTGLRRFGGYIYEEFLQELVGIRGMQTYKEMSSNDPVIGAMLFAIEMLTRQVSWKVEPASSSNEHEADAEFLRSCMDDMSHSWSEMIVEILSMLAYGWSWHETVYKRRLGQEQGPEGRSRFADGKIGWRKIPIRSQDSLQRWEFNEETGDVTAMVQWAPPDYQMVTIPLSKSLLFRPSVHKGNPEGRSVLRNAYRPWFLKRHIENTEAIGIERDLAGLPMALMPPAYLSDDATPEQKQVYEEVKKIVRNLKRDEQEGVVWPMEYDERGNPLFELKLLSSSSGSTRARHDTSKIISRYDQRISVTVLADFILIGHSNFGSFALSSSKTELFAAAIGAWLDSISDPFNRYEIPRLFRLNGRPVDKTPTLAHGDIESPDLKELGAYITNLAGAGMPLFPDEALENELLAAANLRKGRRAVEALPKRPPPVEGK